MLGAAVPLQRLHVDDSDRPPLDEAGGLLVMGGEMGVPDAGDWPFLRWELDLLREAVERGTPVLGICLGAQLLAAAAGGAVRRMEQPVPRLAGARAPREGRRRSALRLAPRAADGVRVARGPDRAAPRRRRARGDRRPRLLRLPRGRARLGQPDPPRADPGDASRLARLAGRAGRGPGGRRRPGAGSATTPRRGSRSSAPPPRPCSSASANSSPPADAPDSDLLRSDYLPLTDP